MNQIQETLESLEAIIDVLPPFLRFRSPASTSPDQLQLDGQHPENHDFVVSQQAVQLYLIHLENMAGSDKHKNRLISLARDLNMRLERRKLRIHLRQQEQEKILKEMPRAYNTGELYNASL